jgi:hypothetical protein
LGFFVFLFNVAPSTRVSSPARPSPTAFRLDVVGLDEEGGPEEKDRFFFSLVSCLFVLESFVSPDGSAATTGSGSGGRPFTWIVEKKRFFEKKVQRL